MSAHAGGQKGHRCGHTQKEFTAHPSWQTARPAGPRCGEPSPGHWAPQRPRGHLSGEFQPLLDWDSGILGLGVLEGRAANAKTLMAKRLPAALLAPAPGRGFCAQPRRVGIGERSPCSLEALYLGSQYWQFTNSSCFHSLSVSGSLTPTAKLHNQFSKPAVQLHYELNLNALFFQTHWELSPSPCSLSLLLMLHEAGTQESSS